MKVNATTQNENGPNYVEVENSEEEMNVLKQIETLLTVCHQSKIDMYAADT